MSFEPYPPKIENPYPPKGWRTLANFTYDSHLYLARAQDEIENGPGRETEYMVSAEYKCSVDVDGTRLHIIVPSGMLTDLTSVPRIGRAFVGRVGPHLEAAIVHDFLFIAWQDMPGHDALVSDFRFANDLMRLAMEVAEVSAFKRAVIHAAVSSLVGWSIFRGKNPGVRYVRVPSPAPGYRTQALA